MAVIDHSLEHQVARGSARPSPAAMVWLGFCVVALLALDWLTLPVWAAVVVVVAGGLAAVPALRPRTAHRVDRTDLLVVAGLYLAVVVLFRVAFTVFTTDDVLGLFLCFAGGLLIGVVGPVLYQVWGRHRPLRSLGVGAHRLRATVVMGLLLAATQFVVTFRGYAMPAPDRWVPLLGMSLVVGLFEAVFFRGFVQGRLEASFGPVTGVVGAAVLYACYHVGYGMGASQMWFLFALGGVYAIAFRLTSNILVIWPLLTPMGSLFNNLDSGEIDLPWASVMGFADVAAVMAGAIWLAHRHDRKVRVGAAGPDDPHGRRQGGARPRG